MFEVLAPVYTYFSMLLSMKQLLPRTWLFRYLPAKIYLFKINNRNTIKWCEIYSKLKIKTPERRQWRRPGVFIVNYEHISHIFSSVFIVDFEQVNVCWVDSGEGHQWSSWKSLSKFTMLDFKKLSRYMKRLKLVSLWDRYTGKWVNQNKHITQKLTMSF